MGQLCCYGILLLLSIICIHGKFIVYDYCVIGAGPGGKIINYPFISKTNARQSSLILIKLSDALMIVKEKRKPLHYNC